jgi:trehalose 6-phosphate phosphatase
VTAAATLADALAPLRADPRRSAVLLDVDGTLAPIVRQAADAHVPERTRALLIEVAKRYGLVACVSGRRASDARRIVSLGTIHYVGSHGAEHLQPGATEPEIDPAVQAGAAAVRAFAAREDTDALRRLRVRLEDKGVIVAFHWRGAPDEGTAEAAVRQLATRAEQAGLIPHWGRKVLEVRPSAPMDKGTGIIGLLRGAGVELDAAVYAGDDTTDLDAFRGLDELVRNGELRTAVCAGVVSDEGPSAIAEEADVTLEGPDGVHDLLAALLD